MNVKEQIFDINEMVIFIFLLWITIFLVNTRMFILLIQLWNNISKLQ